MSNYKNLQNGVENKPNAIILSIKPEYVEKIFNGTKKYEFRKRLARSEIDTIFIYSTYPVMKVVASVKVTGYISDSPDELWKKTEPYAGISCSKFHEYFHNSKIANAYKLGDIFVFDKAKDISEFGLTVAPQSFVYVL